MRVSLPPGIGYCMVEHRAVFLDTRSDRYWLPSPAVTRALATVAKQATSSEADAGALSGLIRSNLLDAGDGGAAVRPCEIKTPNSSFLDDRRPASLADVARSWLDAKAAERRLRRSGLHRSLLHIDLTRGIRAPGARAIEHACRGFAALRLVVTPSGRCLPLSLALAARCADPEVRLVIGVKLGPFAAHAWVQRGDIVLNDHVEAVRPFTPIFVQ